jgi:hypothetical protein
MTCARLGSGDRYAMLDVKYAKVLDLPCSRELIRFTSKLLEFMMDDLPRGGEMFGE